METVKVRIAVIVDEEGYWSACGHSKQSDSRSERIASEKMIGACSEVTYFVEAEIPLPEARTIQGEVKDV